MHTKIMPAQGSHCFGLAVLSQAKRKNCYYVSNLNFKSGQLRTYLDTAKKEDSKRARGERDLSPLSTLSRLSTMSSHVVKDAPTTPDLTPDSANDLHWRDFVEVRKRLCNEVDLVIHNGAQVNWM